MSIELQRAQPGATAQTIRIGKHTLTADMTEAEGGAEAGPSPHDLYDAALGACKALTVLWYANKKGIPVDNIRTSIVRDATDEKAGMNGSKEGGVYRLQTTLYVSGDLSDSQIAELAAVARKCPIHKLMTEVITEIDTIVERIT